MDKETATKAMDEYRDMCDHARWLASSFSQVLPGNLQRFCIEADVLCDLKKELKNWDSSRRKWVK